MTSIKVAIICGGPSPERGISLNSARSVMDHLGSENIEIVPFYVDMEKNYYKLSGSNLYCNTPSDFDFKLSSISSKLSKDDLVSELRKCDIAFPVIHGSYGEDGQIQALFEENNIPYIGCSSSACKQMFYKNKAADKLKENNYKTIPSKTIQIGGGDIGKQIEDFWSDNNIKRAVVKPVAGGSSIGVYSVNSISEAKQKSLILFSGDWGDEILIEEFCEGREFTIIILQNSKGEPVPLIPTEIKISYLDNAIFDYRRKYLPTNNTSWYCPPNFTDNQIDEIRRQAKSLFNLFNMQDFVRIDGWILNNGDIVFTDFNPISGMEQNSFIFQQSSRIGMSHADLLQMVVKSGCKRGSIDVYFSKKIVPISTKKVNVLFGGKTAERQVSVMSGTNIWFKLMKSDIYTPKPYLLDQNGYVWKIPYTYALNHTVEEIYENCLTASATIDRLKKYARIVRQGLELDLKEVDNFHVPERMSFDKFMEQSKEDNAFVFLGLHGGEGENGTIQSKLDEYGLSYNGSGQIGSELCMDKYLTGEAIKKIGNEYISTCPKRKLSKADFIKIADDDINKFWGDLVSSLKSESFVIKPVNDGCSAGIIKLKNADDLSKYINLLRENAPYIPQSTFENQAEIIEMSVDGDGEFLLEAFIRTDVISINGNDLDYKKNTGWLEFTVGVLEQNNEYKSLNPSITVAQGEILSLEEKFQGGTGINITPPPENIISKKDLVIITNAVEIIAKSLNIKNYARIDIFYNVDTKVIIVIEANTLPALTPSTVIYHQALVEEHPMKPTEFLEAIIALVTGDQLISSHIKNTAKTA